jgi:hypothetical protein
MTDNDRFHDIMYTPEGKIIMDQMWHETLEDLKFAGISEVLKSMK